MRKFLLFIVISFALVNFYSCDDFEEIPIKEVSTNFSEDSEDSQEEEPTEDFTYNFSDFLDSSYSFDSSESSSSFDFPDISETTESEETTETTEATETTTASTETTTTETKQTETTSTETTTTTTTTTKTVNEDLVLIDVPYISQKDEYPTGCELVSASMLLKYYGFDITAGEFIDNGYIEKKEPEKDSDKIYCADPNKFFIGDPRTESGYGCYAPALVDALKKYLDGKFCDAVNLSGMSLNDLCMEYIDLDEPVIIWASTDMKPTEKKEEKWIIKETGKEFNWISNEHCLVLVGYDNYYYYFNDPQNGCAVTYRKSDVEARYNELGKQAVIVRLW